MWLFLGSCKTSRSLHWFPTLCLNLESLQRGLLWFPGVCPGSSEVKASACNVGGRPGFDPSVRKITWRRKWQPTPVFLPGESHGRRSLVDYSPRGRKESDTTEQIHFPWLQVTYAVQIASATQYYLKAVSLGNLQIRKLKRGTHSKDKEGMRDLQLLLSH